MFDLLDRSGGLVDDIQFFAPGRGDVHIAVISGNGPQIGEDFPAVVRAGVDRDVFLRGVTAMAIPAARTATRINEKIFFMELS